MLGSGYIPVVWMFLWNMGKKVIRNNEAATNCSAVLL